MTLSIKKYDPSYIDGKLDKNQAMKDCYNGFTTRQAPSVITDENLKKLAKILQRNCVYSNVIWKDNHRSTDNAILSNIDLLVFDIDDTLSLEDVHSNLKVKAMTLTTTSHTEEHHKFRVIIPLQQQVSFKDDIEYIEFLKLLNTELFNNLADKACLEPARAYITTDKAQYKLNYVAESLDPLPYLEMAKQKAFGKRLQFIDFQPSLNTRKPTIEEVKNYNKTQEIASEFSAGNNYEPVYRILGIGKIAGLSNEECAKLIMSYNLGNEYSSKNSLIRKAKLYDKMAS